jgi:hypothetical protein
VGRCIHQASVRQEPGGACRRSTRSWPLRKRLWHGGEYLHAIIQAGQSLRQWKCHEKESVRMALLSSIFLVRVVYLLWLPLGIYNANGGLQVRLACLLDAIL